MSELLMILGIILGMMLATLWCVYGILIWWHLFEWDCPNWKQLTFATILCGPIAWICGFIGLVCFSIGWTYEWLGD